MKMVIPSSLWKSRPHQFHLHQLVKNQRLQRSCSLKRTLASSSTRKRKARKTGAEVIETAEILPQTQATPPPPPAEPATPLLQQTPQPVPTPPRKAKPHSYPLLLALPSKTSVPLNANDRQFLQHSFLPVSNIKGYTLFNAFVTFAAASENNIVLVSRAFASSNITLHGSYIAIRQVFSNFSPP